MILLISDSIKQSYIIQKYLVRHFTVLSVYFKSFEIEYLKDNRPDAVVFNFKRFNETKLELLKTISKRHPEIPIICFTSEQDDLFCDFQNVVVVPKDNHRILIKRLKEIILREPDWGEKINEVKKYIINNIRSISSVEQIVEKFAVEQRKLHSEFKLRTNRSIKSFIVDTRFNLLKDILSKTQELGNYYKIALECGLKNECSVSILIYRKTGKTAKEFHKDLLRSKSDNM